MSAAMEEKKNASMKRQNSSAGQKDSDPSPGAEQPQLQPQESAVEATKIKVFVPKILKTKESRIQTQKCSVRVEKLTEDFVSRTQSVKQAGIASPEAKVEEPEVELESAKSGEGEVHKLDAKSRSHQEEQDKLFDSLLNSSSNVKNQKPDEVTTVPAEVAAQVIPPEKAASGEKLKKRKRKANRTGFPAAKKKKKLTPTLPEPKTPKPQSRPPSVAEHQQQPQQQQPPVRSSSRLQDPSEEQQLPVVEAEPELQVPVKGKRGRPAKSRPNSGSHSAAKRSRIYDEADEEVDCLALLPVAESSGPSSEAQSSAETDDVIGGSNEDLESKKRKKKKHKVSSLQPPFKKNYLVAGLFSEFYKSKTPSAVGVEGSSKKSVSYNVRDHVSTLITFFFFVSDNAVS
jgi:hypothetical protein